MAILKLTIHDVKISKDVNSQVENDLVLSTEQKADSRGTLVLVKKDVELTSKDDKKRIYSLTLQNLEFTKKMYQPTEIHAEIALAFSDPNLEWIPVMGSVIEELFVYKKVSLRDMQDEDPQKLSDSKKVGDDFYVHSVQVKYKVNYMRIYLHIYSLDKLLTQGNDCRTFVGKKLGDGILKEEISKIKAPYDEKKVLSYDAKSMQNLSYKSGDKTTEHIFPFLVQYNESFYDMLARTTNRWGEFMYYEGGKLIVGCPNSTSTPYPLPMTLGEVQAEANTLKVPLFDTISYYNVDELENGSEKFDCAASYDDNMLNDPIRIDPEKVSGNLFEWGGKFDKVVMKKFASFFKNDKNLPTFLGNELFSDLYDLGKQKIKVSNKNSKRKDKFFKEAMKEKAPEQYAEHNYGKKDDPDKAMSYNPFSEIHSVYDKAKYFGILNCEIVSGKNAICINFDTKYPCLNLGQVIKVYDQDYIVTQVECRSDRALKLKNDLWVITTDKVAYYFRVYAIPKHANQFYPTVLPSGHVRLADPQMATVTDAGDPNGNGRVRVMFDWQNVDKVSGNITDDMVKASSPWIQFVANAGGQKGLMGAHYAGDRVFVGFVDGNVERPYVLGAISKGAGADIHCTTPGGHQLKISDDDEGVRAFLTSMFLPMWGTWGDFIPNFGGKNPFDGTKNNLALAGGFELSDNFGIYKISGSTDSREINIQSPWGNVGISAFTGISISAPNGDISIKGKNISIEAGNNLNIVSGKNVDYKLWKEKDTKKGSASQFLLDMEAAVAKKLAEKVVNVVDLSIVRSFLEIIVRPVEGNLTIKSNRYMMLSAGKDKCDYPTEAYSSPEERLKKLDKKAKNDILGGVGFLSVDSAMVELFKSIDGIVGEIEYGYNKTYLKCRELKADLEKKFNKLDEWKNSVGEATKLISSKKFDDLYKDVLTPELWKSEGDYADKKDDSIFQFTDEISIDEKDLDNAVSDKCHNNHFYSMNLASLTEFRSDGIKRVDQAIIDKRKELRKDVLDAYNRLAKEVWYLNHFELNRYRVGKKLSLFTFTPVPEKFKDKMVEAFSRKNLKLSQYYNPVPTEEVKLFKVEAVAFTGNMEDNEKKYIRRVVAMNLLEGLGFDDSFRKDKVGGNPGAVPPVPARDAKKPKTDAVSGDEGYICNNQTWYDYVDSLNGVPALGKDQTTIGAVVKGAAADAIDNLAFWKSITERSTWSEGKNGRILFGVNKGTYAFEKGDENVIFKKQDVLKTEITNLKASDYRDDTPEHRNIVEFVEKIKEGLRSL